MRNKQTQNRTIRVRVLLKNSWDRPRFCELKNRHSVNPNNLASLLQV